MLDLGFVIIFNIELKTLNPQVTFLSYALRD